MLLEALVAGIGGGSAVLTRHCTFEVAAAHQTPFQFESAQQPTDVCAQAALDIQVGPLPMTVEIALGKFVAIGDAGRIHMMRWPPLLRALKIQALRRVRTGDAVTAPRSRPLRIGGRDKIRCLMRKL